MLMGAISKDSLPVARSITQGGMHLCSRFEPMVRAALLGAISSLLIGGVMAQPATPTPCEAQTSLPGTRELSLAPAKVDVKPLARDEEIRKRLQNILIATEWFADPEVRVEEGVVFLEGRATSEALKNWAGDLASNTQDVVAVVNRMKVPAPSVWDLSPAAKGLLKLWRDFIRSLPLILVGGLILALSVGAGVLTSKGARISSPAGFAQDCCAM